MTSPIEWSVILDTARAMYGEAPPIPSTVDSNPVATPVPDGYGYPLDADGNCTCADCVASRRRTQNRCSYCGFASCHDNECLSFQDSSEEGDYCDGCDHYGDCECDNDGDRASNRGILRNYSYRPIPSFYGKGPLFLGMELELESRDFDDTIEVAAQAFGDLAYFKEDGSLGAGGFEIVTHPMDYTYATDHFPFEALTDLQRAGGYIRESSNGIHVHVSRAGFAGPCHMFRWMKLLYRNEREVSRLARRRSSEWASFDSYARQAQKEIVKPGSRGQRASRGLGRYHAINTANEQTLEVRVFASTLDPEVAAGTLAFVASSVEYTRGLDSQKVIKGDGWAWGRYVSWLRDRETYTPALDLMEATACAY